MTQADPSGEQARLAALFELDLLHGGPFPDLDRLMMLAADICNANLASFTVHDSQRAYQVSTSFGARETMPKDECMCSAALERSQTVHSADARVDRRVDRVLDFIFGDSHSDWYGDRSISGTQCQCRTDGNGCNRRIVARGN